MRRITKAYKQEKRLINEFFDELEWGILFNELIIYLEGKDVVIDYNARIVLKRYVNKKYRKLKTWKTLADALLQTTSGGGKGDFSIFGMAGSKGGDSYKNLVNSYLTTQAFILAKHNEHALLRLLFEIDDRWKVMESMDVSGKPLIGFNSGYRAMLELKKKKSGLTYDELLDAVGYAKGIKTTELYPKRTINPLRELTFIAKKGQKYLLADWVREVWKKLPKYKEKIKEFEPRKGPWLMPDVKAFKGRVERRETKRLEKMWKENS